jgi:hypothetical protein
MDARAGWTADSFMKLIVLASLVMDATLYQSCFTAEKSCRSLHGQEKVHASCMAYGVLFEACPVYSWRGATGGGGRMEQEYFLSGMIGCVLLS